MKKRDIRTLDTASLVTMYARSAAAHGRSLDTADSKSANRHADVLAAVYRELRARGRDAQLALMPLLNDPDPNVRVWAAGHALEFAPEDGEKVLTEMAAAFKGLIGWSAEMTLKEWRKGTLKFS